MPHFYFDFEIGDNSYRDEHGIALENLEIARRATMRVLPALVREELAGTVYEGVRLKIRDQNGGVVWNEKIAREEFDRVRSGAGEPPLYTS